MITTQFRSHLHGLCTVTAEPDCSRSNTTPSWKKAKAFDCNGHPVPVEPAAIEELDAAWSGELRYPNPSEESGCDGVIEVLS